MKYLKSGKVRNFLDGFTSAFDLSGQSFISIPDLDTGFLQDREAMKGDWRCIGGDMRRVMNSMTNAR
jgi:hypothetical protein